MPLREARTVAALATAASLTAGAAIGAAATAAAGPATGLLTGGLAALATTWGALGAVRLLVTRPRD
jgi:uncharacterized membrane protein YhiD involved in acid resistance